MKTNFKIFLIVALSFFTSFNLSANNTFFSFESRALPSETLNKPYKKYKVIKEITDVKSGPVIPWFGKEGKGVQYEFKKGINKLLSEEYIIEVP